MPIGMLEERSPRFGWDILLVTTPMKLEALKRETPRLDGRSRISVIRRSFWTTRVPDQRFDLPPLADWAKPARFLFGVSLRMRLADVARRGSSYAPTLSSPLHSIQSLTLTPPLSTGFDPHPQLPLTIMNG